LSPNPFSPDNDGWEDVTMIRYRLPYTSAMISIKLFDDHGRMAKHIVNNEYSTSIGNIVYNGLNEDNNPLPIGMYIVLLEAADAQTGNHCVMKAVLVSARKMR
jgi:hypothetical protein